MQRAQHKLLEKERGQGEEGRHSWWSTAAGESGAAAWWVLRGAAEEKQECIGVLGVHCEQYCSWGLCIHGGGYGACMCAL